ncbi:MAG: TlyA family rRNA (cytidine-2'-O)-methyltransferase [Acidimicrobiales bacterium]
MAKGQTRRIPLGDLVRRRWPGWDPTAIESAISAGELLVEGRILTNPAARVPLDAPLRHEPSTDLAGHRKLSWAIDCFGVDATDRVALDIGACTGGFTTAWLEAGARRVYAVDAGHGQLLGSLRLCPEVVNLERTNVGSLTPALVPEAVHLVSVDVSYLALAAAVSQIGGLDTDGAVLVGLVKPMFELRLATIPSDPATLGLACERAAAGVGAAGWDVLQVAESPVRGARGAVEYFLHGVRR